MREEGGGMAERVTDFKANIHLWGSRQPTLFAEVGVGNSRGLFSSNIYGSFHYSLRQ